MHRTVSSLADAVACMKETDEKNPLADEDEEELQTSAPLVSDLVSASQRAALERPSNEFGSPFRSPAKPSRESLSLADRVRGSGRVSSAGLSRSPLKPSQPLVWTTNHAEERVPAQTSPRRVSAEERQVRICVEDRLGCCSRFYRPFKSDVASPSLHQTRFGPRTVFPDLVRQPKRLFFLRLVNLPVLQHRTSACPFRPNVLLRRHLLPHRRASLHLMSSCRPHALGAPPETHKNLLKRSKRNPTRCCSVSRIPSAT